jgi:hypothetical protein
VLRCLLEAAPLLQSAAEVLLRAWRLMAQVRELRPFPLQACLGYYLTSLLTGVLWSRSLERPTKFVANAAAACCAVLAQVLSDGVKGAVRMATPVAGLVQALLGQLGHALAPLVPLVVLT